MTRTIKIILLQDVPQLGQKGEVRSVRFGFVKNWLIPRRLAVIATPLLISQMEKMKALREEQMKRETKSYQDQMKKLEDFTLHLRPKKTKKGTLYAAIDAKVIAQHLKKKNITLDPKYIHLETPIKKIGEYEVTIIFSEAFKSKLKVVVQ